MMGSGKTSIGRALAERLKMIYVDTDVIIEERTQKSITEIFREWGEKRFRELEKCLFEEMAKQNDQVFSTGGGIVLDESSRRILREQGFTVLLEAPPGILAKRIEKSTSRPLLNLSKNVEKNLLEIWEEREEAYRSVAFLTVNTHEMTHAGAVDKIIRHVKMNHDDH